ncbi:autotransporter domain-containing protein [Phyllobacterium sp. 628]|uniref:autotransporter domain-containing protein n=1 Tax=Phyllobacterium sp. 628 TaxID=2718938 RepID=UPI00166234FA|nr:autotransporter serine protease [Phyllobacterium sp. 628]QND53427.1 autotransporter domain-containing protein [Phyllobacterium sp. 628]
MYTQSIFSDRHANCGKYRHYKAALYASVVLSAAVFSLPVFAQNAPGQYFNADGSRTNDLEAAAQTWRTPEFNKDWGLSAMRAEYAYALGYSGKNTKTGVMDSGIDINHPEFKDKNRIHTVDTKGVYSSDSTQYEGNGALPFKKGDSFDISGAYNPAYNDSHGTHVSGSIGAARDNQGMHGVAFDTNIYVANTHGTDSNRLQGSDSLDYNYFMAAYDALASQGVKFVNNSWGSDSRYDTDYFENQTGTIPDFVRAYSNFWAKSQKGEKTWLDAVGDASNKHGIIQIVSASNDGPMQHPDLFAALPYFRPELEGRWLAVAWADPVRGPDRKPVLGKYGDISLYSNRCGVSRYWCVDAPGGRIYSSVPDGKYATYDGTSMSAPHASGALAVIQSRFPYMTPEQVLSVMLTTSGHDGVITRHPSYDDGWGNIDLKNAMNGPGQFMGKFAVSLPGGISDTWSNDITDEALKYRRDDEAADQAVLKKSLSDKGWDKGLPANASNDDKAAYDYLTKIIAIREDAIAQHAKVTQCSLEKLGDGHLILEGKNTYTGSTWVRGGTLSVNGSITSDVTVDGSGIGVVDPQTGITTTTGGILGGNGFVGGLMVHAGGTVAPGNSVGTLTANGDASFDPGSRFAVEVNGNGNGGADKLTVGGKTTLLGGIVTVSPENGKEPLTPAETLALLNKSYTILTSTGGVSGAFDSVLPAYLFIGGALAYDPNDVMLTLSRNGVAFADVGQTKNEKSVGNALEALGLGDTLYDTVATATYAANLPADFDSLSGEIHASVQGVLAEDSRFVRDAATNRIRSAFGDGTGAKASAPVLAYGPDGADKAGTLAAADTKTTAIWAEGYGSWSQRDGTSNASGLSRNVGGFVTGLDGIIADGLFHSDWRLGLLAGYGNTSIHTDRGHGSADSYQVGVYGGTKLDAMTLSLGASLAHHAIDTSRRAHLLTIDEGDDAAYTAKSVQVFGEASYRIDTPYAALEPFAGAAYVHLKTDGFAETGGLTALSSNGDTTDLTTTTLGLRASHGFAICDATILTAHGMAGWRHAFGDTTPTANLAFASGSAFSIDGLPIAQDTALVEAGFDVNIGKATSLGISYNGQFSANAHDNAVKADLTVKF